MTTKSDDEHSGKGKDLIGYLIPDDKRIKQGKVVTCVEIEEDLIGHNGKHY